MTSLPNIRIRPQDDNNQSQLLGQSTLLMRSPRQNQVENNQIEHGSIPKNFTCQNTVDYTKMEGIRRR